MKNIIKRGTSLLLVVAMLLSFAAVVGAESATTESITGNKLVTLRANPVAIKAGETVSVPIYVDIAEGIGLGMLKFNVYCDSGVSIEEIRTNTSLGGTYATGENSTNSNYKVISWISNNPLGWSQDPETGDTIKNTTVTFAWLRVKAATDVGGYEIHFAQFDNGKPQDATDTAFSVIESDRADVVKDTTFKLEDTKLEDGAAIVYDPQNLPMVALTKTTFDVPTMEKWLASGRNSGDYPIAPYLKIVAKEGDEVKVFDVSSDYLTTSLGGNKLGLTPSTTAATDKKFTVTRAEAAGASHSVTTETELTYSVRKEQSDLWKAGFGTNSGYYEEPSKILTANGNGSYLNTQGEVMAPEYGATVSWRPIGLYPNVFDQYGSSKTLSGYTVKATVTLYNVADTTLSTPLETSDDAYNCVNFTGNSGTSNINNLYVSNQLAKDVRCKVQLETYQGETLVDGKGETLSFVIRNTKPYAAGISIKLKSSVGEELTDTNFTIPTGNETLQIKIVPTVNSQFGTPLDVQPEVTVTASNGTTSYNSTSTEGVKLENNVLTITSDAWKQMASTENSTTITIQAHPTDNESLVATKTITLTKAQPVATSIGSEATEGGKTVLVSGRIDLMAESNNLPGIGKTINNAAATRPLYVIDQYGQHVENDGKNVTVPAENFKLYPAVKADDGDVENVANTEKYKKTSDTPISKTYVTFKDNGSGGMMLALTNAWDDNTNGLALPEGPYIIEATYPAENGGTLKAKCLIMLVKATGQWLEYTATVTASSNITVPYANSSEPYNDAVLTATVTDQYGEALAAGTYVKMELDGKVKLYDSNGTQITELENADNAVQVTQGAFENQRKVKVSKDLAKYMVKDGTVVTNGELRLPVKVTVTDKDGKTLKTFEGLTAKVNVSREASALKKATVVMKQGETVVQTVNLDERPDNQKKVNIISPKANTTYTFTVTGEDQYGDAMATTYALSDGKPNQTGFTRDGQTLKVDANAEGEVVLDVVQSPSGMTYRVTLTFAKMQFVKGADDDTEIKASDMLDDTKIPRTYDGLTWKTILDDVKKNQDVYIKNEVEGGQNTEVEANSISYKVVSVDADGHETEIPDTAKANAGSYKIKVIYTKDGQTYDVCEKTFTISPKPITIGLKNPNQTITKPYDGGTTLPSGLELGPKDTVEHDRVNLIPGNLEFAQKDVKLKDDGTVDSIPIRVKAGMVCLEGDDADNYTVKLDGDDNIDGLSGTITKRTIVVTPKSSDKVNLTYGDDVAGKLASEYTTNINELPTTCVAPTIEGSMALTKGETEASAPYDAGEYTVALGSLSVGSNYRLELASGTHTWTIGKKTIKFLLTCEREADYGVYGRELYGELETMIASTDAGSKNIKELFDTSKLEFRGSAGTTTVAKTGDVVVDAGTYAVTAESLTLAMSNNYDVQDAQVQITVKKHTIVSDDIKQNGGTQSVTFSGERQTLTNYKVSFTYKDREITLAKNQDFAVLENSNTILDTSTRLKVKAAENSANYEGEATASWSWYILARSVSTDDIEVSQVNVPTYDGNEHQVEIAVNHIGPNKDEAWLKFFTVNNIYFRTGDKATDAGEHTLAFSLTGPYTSGRDVDPSKRLCELRWTIEKSNEKPIGDQTANTKYGQPGSIEIAVPTGAAKGLTTSNLSVSALTDNDQIVDGTPSATFENGKIVVNWKLRGDATTIGKSATLRVTVAKSDNYKEYSFKIIVTAAKKDAQDKFFIATEDGRSAYSYSEAGVLMQASGNQTDVTWSIDPSYQEYAEIIDGSYVKFKKPGTVVIKASAEETDTYAAAEQTYTLTITKGQVTITASSATMTANDPLPGFSATASGLNPKDSVSKVFQTLTATVSTDGKTAGTFRVTPNAVFKTGVKDWNEYYELSFVQGTLTVNPAVSVIDTVLPTIIAGNGCANGYANCACESFYDLDASRWYHEAIDWAYSLGLMNGTTKSTFGPNAAATRAQTWTMLARIAGQDTRRSSTWYEVGQKWAVNLGITDGTNPMGSLTREQLAAMLYRYVGSPAVNGTLTFTDSANVSAWARNAMIWAVQNGILDGVGGNRLNPKGTTTRAQAAAIFMRFSKLINK